MLVNARHVKNLPGRKSDVADATWLAQLGEHGLVRGSFVPPEPIRQLRDLTRARTAITRERGREVERLEKLLEDASIKLASVASDITGVSGRAMLEALIAGQDDPAALADLAKRRLRSKIPALTEALTGRFTEHHGFLARVHLDLNTKNHTGQAVWVTGRTLMVAGKKQRHLYNAAHEASRAAALLSRRMGGPVPVTAVVVTLAPKSLTVRASPEGAVVLTATRLLGWLAARPRILGPGQIGMLSAVACQPGTWHRDPPSMMDPARIRQEFAALRAAVNRARACRIGWLLALLISAPLILSSLSRHF